MSFHPTSPLRSLQVLAKLLCFGLLLTGCGGGGTSNTALLKTSYISGPIRGFGSVIINGVRLDVSAASVANDDEQAQTESDLMLGMMADAEAGEIAVDSSGPHGAAKSIHFRSAIVGPVSTVDTATKTLVVLGQTVDATATTVFDASLTMGMSSIASGDVVAVYAMFDSATGHYLATRIEPKVNAAYFKLRGAVSSLDTMGRTFKIGSETISYVSLAANQVPADLANGVLVVVKLKTVQASGAWVVRPLHNQDEAELEGVITSFTSTTSFSVDGVAVDATNATFPDGTAGVVLGARVEVEGSASTGTLVATKVTIETENSDMLSGFDLHGPITMLDAAAKTFVLRGVTVNYGGPAVVYKNGMESDLAVARKVEVKGVLSTDGTKLDATAISFEV